MVWKYVSGGLAMSVRPHGPSERKVSFGSILLINSRKCGSGTIKESAGTPTGIIIALAILLANQFCAARVSK